MPLVSLPEQFLLSLDNTFLFWQVGLKACLLGVEPQSGRRRDLPLVTSSSQCCRPFRHGQRSIHCVYSTTWHVSHVTSTRWGYTWDERVWCQRGFHKQHQQSDPELQLSVYCGQQQQHFASYRLVIVVIIIIIVISHIIIAVHNVISILDPPQHQW